MPTYLRRLLPLFLIATFCVAGVSCKWLSRRSYKVDKPSPTGAYRVKVDVKVEDYYELLAGFHEWGKIELLKGDEIVDSRDWDINDNFETTFIDGTPVIEWTGNNVLRMGRRQEGLFLDEVVVSNNTGENLKYVGISSDKHEELTVFDLAAGDRITLRSSPVPRWTDGNGSIKYTVGYGGKSQTGKGFSGFVDESQRKVSAEGPARFQIVIRQEDLR